MLTTLQTTQLWAPNITAHITKLEDEVARINNNNYWIVWDHLQSITTGWFFKRPKYTVAEIESDICSLKTNHWYDPWDYRYNHLNLTSTARLLKDIEILNDIMNRRNRNLEITLNEREFEVLDQIKYWR